jgi:hypothetical protein
MQNRAGNKAGGGGVASATVSLTQVILDAKRRP